MVKRSLLNKAKTAEFQKGIFDNVMITNVDTQDRKGNNGPINKMIYIKFAQINETGKKLHESELAWWKPDITSEFFQDNLREICFQLHNVLEVFIGEEEAYNAFEGVFEALNITDQVEIGTRKWKQSEVNALIVSLKASFEKAITPWINNTEHLMRLKLTTNFKGEDIDFPKYGKFVEPTTVTETTLKFTSNELKTHSKAGNVEVKTIVSSANSTATI